MAANNHSRQSSPSFLYFPLFNNRTSRHSEDEETAKLRDLLEDLSDSPLPIGLKLNLESSDLVDSIEKQLNRDAVVRISQQKRNRTQALVAKAERSKADHFPFSLLRIGAFRVAATYASDLVAKCYYGKRKLVWEILHNGLKNKIEIPWQDILAMRATIQENRPGILELELNQPPSFLHEIDPKPRQHTLWRPSLDFTGGQASNYRRHYLEFPPGILEKHYEKLMSDSQLLQLSQRAFPTLATPYFNPNMPFGSSQPIPTSQQQPVLPRGNIPPSPTSVGDNLRNLTLTFRNQEIDGFGNLAAPDLMSDDSDNAVLRNNWNYYTC